MNTGNIRTNGQTLVFFVASWDSSGAFFFGFKNRHFLHSQLYVNKYTYIHKCRYFSFLFYLPHSWLLYLQKGIHILLHQWFFNSYWSSSLKWCICLGHTLPVRFRLVWARAHTGSASYPTSPLLPSPPTAGALFSLLTSACWAFSFLRLHSYLLSPPWADIQ